MACAVDPAGREVSLGEVLAAREARAAAQRRLLAEYGRPLVGLTMNLPGPVKRGALSDLAFWDGLDRLRETLGERILHLEITDVPAGLEALLVCRGAAEELKALAVALEEQGAVGRLYDVDVLRESGEKLAREVPRTCLVCGGPAAPCARSRAHGLKAVQSAVRDRLVEFAAAWLAERGVEALLDEVELTPKPGLVDRNNAGAHSDMDLPLFRRSAQVLAPYFHRAAELGLTCGSGCMPLLQQAGRQAEAEMLAATGGVNTHRGAVYSVGILLAALGTVLRDGGDVFARAAALAADGIPPQRRDGTHGPAVAERFGASGARGEALAGFPHAREAQRVLADPEGGPQAALLTLLSCVEDTNLLYRGGREGLALVREKAAEILAGSAAQREEGLLALDQLCIRRGLSPGGSADLLALALLLHSTRRVWQGSGQTAG